jgi:hypothetical protein
MREEHRELQAQPAVRALCRGHATGKDAMASASRDLTVLGEQLVTGISARRFCRLAGELVPKQFQQPPPPVGESHVVAAAGAPGQPRQQHRPAACW